MNRHLGIMVWHNRQPPSAIRHPCSRFPRADVKTSESTYATRNTDCYPPSGGDPDKIDNYDAGPINRGHLRGIPARPVSSPGTLPRSRVLSPLPRNPEILDNNTIFLSFTVQTFYFSLFIYSHCTYTMTTIPKQHRAAVYSEPGKLQTKIELVDTPEPGPGEVLVNLYDWISLLPIRICVNLLNPAPILAFAIVTSA